jgi:hypothetical protein
MTRATIISSEPGRAEHHGRPSLELLTQPIVANKHRLDGWLDKMEMGGAWYASPISLAQLNEATPAEPVTLKEWGNRLFTMIVALPVSLLAYATAWISQTPFRVMVAALVLATFYLSSIW